MNWNLHTHGPRLERAGASAGKSGISGRLHLIEGIVETDWWFGPLFTNLRLTRTHKPVHLRADFPLLQVQPLPREAYAETTLNATAIVPDMSGMSDEDWSAYHATIVTPTENPDRPFGAYAVAARKRRQSGCPFSGQDSGRRDIRDGHGRLTSRSGSLGYPGQAQPLRVPVPILASISGDRARATPTENLGSNAISALRTEAASGVHQGDRARQQAL